MASRVAGKIKLQSVDELLGVPEIAGFVCAGSIRCAAGCKQ